MKAHLNLVDHLLQKSRHHQQMGQWREAVRMLRQLADFRQLPAPVAEQTQVRLAELHLKRRQYARARRHLSSALQHRPDSARYHYLLAACWHADSQHGDPERAADHYQQSLQLNPHQIKCLADFGLASLKQGNTEEGLRCLRQAVERAPDNPRILSKLVKGLLQVGQADEARQVLRAGLFRNPHNAAIRKLHDDFQFQELRRQQETERLSNPVDEEEPVLLPFVRPGESQNEAVPSEEESPSVSESASEADRAVVFPCVPPPAVPPHMWAS